MYNKMKVKIFANIETQNQFSESQFGSRIFLFHTNFGATKHSFTHTYICIYDVE